MKRKVILSISCITIIVVLTFAFIWKQTWIASSVDGASDSDKGVTFWGKTWNSLDGTAQIAESGFNYSSLEDARKEFEDDLKGGAVIERTKLSETEERAVVVAGHPDTKGGAATIIRLQNKEIRYVNAPSLKYALAFEKSWIKLD